MTRWKKLSKALAGTVLAVVVTFSASVATFAYVDPAAEAAGTETVQEEAPKEETLEENGEDNKQEAVLPEEGQEDTSGTAFSVPGNGEVQDDITDDSTKEFLTVTTKNNNTFYIVIDRSATSQNVYMLSQVDENDLKEFLDEETKAEMTTPTPSVVLEETPETEEPKEEEEKKAASGANVGAMAVILALAVLGIGGYYYFKVYKPKQEEEDDRNEGLEAGEDDGLRTVNEEEEEKR